MERPALTMLLPNDRVPQVSDSVGFFAFDTRQLAQHWARALGPPWSPRPVAFGSLDAAMAACEPGSPWSRDLYLPIGSWTAMVGNGPCGTDLGMMPRDVVRDLGCTVVRAVLGSPRERRSTILDVHGPGGEGPFNEIRSIAAHYEGRWEWHESGDRLPFEEVQAYSARRVRDRFTPQMLQRYLDALGVPIRGPIDLSGCWLVENAAVQRA